jgi:hypothetical protein
MLTVDHGRLAAMRDAQGDGEEYVGKEERLHRERLRRIAGMTPEQKKREIERLDREQSKMWDEGDEATSGPRRNGRKLAVVDEDLYLPAESEESRVLSIIASQAVKLPAGISRLWFNQAVASVVVATLQDAASGKELGELFEGDGYTRSEMELAARLLAELIDATNPRLQAKCLAFVLGLNIGGGKSETAIALEEGVGRATVSKRCVRLKQVFALNPSRGMKSEAAVRSYSKRQTGKRARPKPIAWSLSGLLKGVLDSASVIRPATA